MLTSTTRFSFVSILLGFVLTPVEPAGAIIIDRGDYTQDSRSGLAFLDLTLSTNFSVQHVSSSFGTFGQFAGHRYATLNEVLELFSHAGLPAFGTFQAPASEPQLQNIFDLQDLVGRTNTAPGGAFTRYISQGAISEFVTPGSLVQAPFFEAIDFVSSNDLATVNSSGLQPTFAGPTVGHWLVLVATPLGYREGAPILPTSLQGPAKHFDEIDGRGAWFDPAAANGYQFVVTDGMSQFTTVGMPESSSDLDQLFMVSDGINHDVIVAAGEDYFFDTPVSSFTITGIDLQDEGESFSVFLMFDNEQSSFSMIALPVPEPASNLLLATGVILTLTRRKTTGA